ncbi:vitellogenin-A2-like [Ptychodera flava]|uniref:vitellogenin-A2-like n=1 Tax=Ptychodera flava TaxID=63121 RepID=UPI003969E10C
MCVPFLERIVGAEICCNMEYVPRAGFAHSPYMPLNGPIRIAASWIPEALPPQKVKISLTNREPFSWESIRRGKLDSIFEIQTIGGQRQSDVELAFTYNDQTGTKIIELSADVKQEERQKMRLTYSSQDVYRQAELLVAMGRNYEEYIMKNTYLVETTPQIKLNIKSTVNSIPERLVPTLEMIKMYLQTFVYLYDIAEVSMESNAARTLETSLMLRSPDILDVQVKLPGVTMIRHGMRLPVPITEVPGPQTHIIRNVADTLQNVFQSQYATCKVLNNQYVTYDNVTYHYQPPGGCYHVLTKDGAIRGKFMVLMSRYEKDPTRKIVKIHVGNKIVKLLPDMTVKVNDRKVNVYENQKYEYEHEFFIYKYQQNITFEAYIGLYIVYTGENVVISVQPIYHARTVGLCGNDDDEQTDEFILPDHSVVSDPTVFAHSWIIKGYSCSDACKLEPKYKIIRETINDEYQKCFSTVPVSHCLRGCEPRETNTVTVGFHCVPADYSSVSRMEQMIMSNRPEDLHLASKSIDMYRMVEAVVACDCDRCANLPRPYS